LKIRERGNGDKGGQRGTKGDKGGQRGTKGDKGITGKQKNRNMLVDLFEEKMGWSLFWLGSPQALWGVGRKFYVWLSLVIFFRSLDSRRSFLYV
jgi:hypothetical protein